MCGGQPVVYMCVCVCLVYILRSMRVCDYSNLNCQLSTLNANDNHMERFTLTTKMSIQVTFKWCLYAYHMLYLYALEKLWPLAQQMTASIFYFCFVFLFFLFAVQLQLIFDRACDHALSVNILLQGERNTLINRQKKCCTVQTSNNFHCNVFAPRFYCDSFVHF